MTDAGYESVDFSELEPGDAIRAFIGEDREMVISGTLDSYDDKEAWIDTPHAGMVQIETKRWLFARKTPERGVHGVLYIASQYTYPWHQTLYRFNAASDRWEFAFGHDLVWAPTRLLSDDTPRYPLNPGTRI